MSVGDKLRAELTNIESLIGKKQLKEMFENGYSVPTYHQSRKAIKYIGLEENADNIKRTLNWIMKFKQTKSLREFMDKKLKPHVLFLHIDCDIPLAL